MESLTACTRDLSTSAGSVSSRNTFGPFAVGPKAQMDRAASLTQSYFMSNIAAKRMESHVA